MNTCVNINKVVDGDINNLKNNLKNDYEGIIREIRKHNAENQDCGYSTIFHDKICKLVNGDNVASAITIPASRAIDHEGVFCLQKATVTNAQTGTTQSSYQSTSQNTKDTGKAPNIPNYIEKKLADAADAKKLADAAAAKKLADAAVAKKLADAAAAKKLADAAADAKKLADAEAAAKKLAEEAAAKKLAEEAAAKKRLTELETLIRDQLGQPGINPEFINHINEYIKLIGPQDDKTLLSELINKVEVVRQEMIDQVNENNRIFKEDLNEDLNNEHTKKIEKESNELLEAMKPLSILISNIKSKQSTKGGKTKKSRKNKKKSTRSKKHKKARKTSKK